MIDKVLYITRENSIGWARAVSFAKERNLPIFACACNYVFFKLFTANTLVVYGNEKGKTFVQKLKNVMPICVNSVSAFNLDDYKMPKLKSIKFINKEQVNKLFNNMNIFPISVSEILIVKIFEKIINYNLKSFCFKMFEVCCNFLNLDYKKEVFRIHNFLLRWIKKYGCELKKKYSFFTGNEHLITQFFNFAIKAYDYEKINNFNCGGSEIKNILNKQSLLKKKIVNYALANDKKINFVADNDEF